MAFRQLVSMERTDEEKRDAAMPVFFSGGSDYPCGLCICLTEAELEKLNLDDEEVEVGDYIDLRAFGRVTSVSKNDSGGGQKCRIEIQIEMLGVENEATEDDDDDD